MSTRTPRSRRPNAARLLSAAGVAIAAVCFGVVAPALSSSVSELLSPSEQSAHRQPTLTHEGADEPAAPAAPEVSPVVPENDYYTVLGPAQRDREPARTGVVEYCTPDALGRAGCAYGELTPQLREQARRRGRESITVDPSGWSSDNTEVAIAARDDVEGSRDYRGWFWNRSHLIADSLGGSANRENLVAGTRTQNVGSTQTDGQYSGGMAYTELIARDYLDSSAARSCPLYYAATPVYHADELIPRTVFVDIQSCDKSIDQRVEVSNTANGWDIDYRTGAFRSR